MSEDLPIADQIEAHLKGYNIGVQVAEDFAEYMREKVSPAVEEAIKLGAPPERILRPLAKMWRDAADLVEREIAEDS